MTRSEVYERFVGLTSDEPKCIVQLESILRELNKVCAMDDSEIRGDACNDLFRANVLIRHYRMVLRALAELTSIGSVVSEKLDLERECFVKYCVEELQNLYNEFQLADDYE